MKRRYASGKDCGRRWGETYGYAIVKVRSRERHREVVDIGKRI